MYWITHPVHRPPGPNKRRVRRMAAKRKIRKPRAIAKAPPLDSPDREHYESIVGEYERITGRNWEDLEKRMNRGEPAATIVFAADYIAKLLKRLG
jgi:hypothetical protein